MKITWKPDFSVGVEAIDKQHMELIEIANELNNHDSVVELDSVIGKVRKYIQTHFEFEEMLMAKYAYPKKKQHVVQHDVLRVSYDAFVKGSKSQEDVKRIRTLIFQWFVNHVIEDKHDMDLGKFLNSLRVSIKSQSLA
jgi:hemerythrin